MTGEGSFAVQDAESHKIIIKMMFIISVAEPKLCTKYLHKLQKCQKGVERQNLRRAYRPSLFLFPSIPPRACSRARNRASILRGLIATMKRSHSRKSLTLPVYTHFTIVIFWVSKKIPVLPRNRNSQQPSVIEKYSFIDINFNIWPLTAQSQSKLGSSCVSQNHQATIQR